MRVFEMTSAITLIRQRIIWAPVRSLAAYVTRCDRAKNALDSGISPTHLLLANKTSCPESDRLSCGTQFHKLALCLREIQTSWIADTIHMASTAGHASEKDAPGPDVSTLPRASSSPERAHHNDEEGLPPRDQGRAAWTCLVAISAISMATWGALCKSSAYSMNRFNFRQRLWRHSGCLPRILF